MSGRKLTEDDFLMTTPEGDFLYDTEAIDGYASSFDATQRCAACGTLVFLNHDDYEEEGNGTVMHRRCAWGVRG